VLWLAQAPLTKSCRCAHVARAAQAAGGLWLTRNAPWRRPRVASAQVLQVAAAELRSLKPSRAVYAQRGEVFFLTPRDQALRDTQARLAAAAAAEKRSS
jgi:hypothetical protein